MWRVTAFDRDGRQVNSLELEGGEVTIGRDTDRKLVLPSAAVSRRHAKLVLNEPQPFVVDEGSANGMLVNGVRITGPTAIVPGVRVNIADFYLEFARLTPVPMTEAVAPIEEAPRNFDPSDVVRLVANGGPFDGRIYDIPPGEMAVGRAVDNDLVLDDPSLSRRHAKMRRAGVGRIEIEDLNSSNGSFVNGRKVGKGSAGPGDTVRFGDLIFRVMGARSDGTRAIVPAQPWKGYFVWGGLAALLLIVGVVAAVLLLRPRETPPKENPVEQAKIAAEHVRKGKAMLTVKKFAEAESEFDQAVNLDPANAEARRLKALAESEPAAEKQSSRIIKKLESGDRSSLESAARTMDRFPKDSSFFQPTAEKVASKLSGFGEAQCKARKWVDCAWALCRAFEVAPEGARPDAEMAALMSEAEKKAGKAATRCKVRR